MRILQYPEDQKLLRTPGKLITSEIFASSDFQKNLQAMMEILEQSGDGIGLAATQVGIPLQFFILTVDEQLEKINPTIYLNPKITVRSKKETKDIEGCLSFQGLAQVKVPRSEEITWEYQTTDFQFHQQSLSGYYARIIMHEYDHLQGRLIIDYLSSAQMIKVQQWLKNKASF